MTESKQAGKVEHAQALAVQGYGIFPVWGAKGTACRCPKGEACTSKAKHPVTADGFKSATTDPDSIRTFLKGTNNYGVVPPEHVFILDVDGPDVERLDRLAEDYGALPSTYTVLTANGKHVYYAWPDGTPRPDHKMFGLITRWGGGRGQGYVIGPGSTHASGYVYAIDNGPRGSSEVATFPGRWARAATIKPVEFTIPGGPAELPTKGGRHEWLRDRARNLAGVIRDPDVLLAAMLAENDRLEEPKSPEEVRQSIGDVLEKYEADPEVTYVDAAHFTEAGLGWAMRDTFNEHRVTLEVQELHERRGEIRATLTVVVDDEERTRTIESLQSATNTARLADALEVVCGKLGIHWPSILTGFYRRVLDEWERPEELAVIGGDPIVDPAYLIKPVLIKDVATILFAKEGTGKSTLAAGMAVSVATGTPLFDGWEVEEPAPVLVLDWETSQDDWNAHVALIANGLGVPKPANVYYRHMAQPITKDIKQTAKMIGKHGIRLVVVDSTMMAGPSGGSEAAEGALELFRALRVLGATVLLVDHLNKQTPSGDSARPYGSVYKPALARATFELYERDTPPLYSAANYQHLTLAHRKANLTERQPDTFLRIERYGLLDDGGQRLVFDLEEPLFSKSKQLEEIEKHLPGTSRKIAQQTGIPAAVVERELEQRPQAYRLTVGEWSVIEQVDSEVILERPTDV